MTRHTTSCSVPWEIKLCGDCCSRNRLPSHPAPLPHHSQFNQSSPQNTPADIYEQEAGRVSDQVMRMSSPHPQHACFCLEMCPRCQSKQNHSATISGSEHPVAPPQVHQLLASSGHPLGASARAFFEPLFGHDFSNVRVHVGSLAE